MTRVLVAPGTLAASASIPLSEDESHHLQVRRISDGAEAFALDGAGTTATGTVQRAGKEWTFLADSITEFPPPPGTLLAVAAGDRDRFQYLVEKAAELGVTRIIPLETEHSRQVATRLREGALTKLRRVALEACKQSGNPWSPQIQAPVSVSDLKSDDPSMHWFLADLNGQPMPAVDPAAPVAWLIGPEGGFTEGEILSLASRLNPVLTTLGRHMLRFETAAIAAAVMTIDRRANA